MLPKSHFGMPPLSQWGKAFPVVIMIFLNVCAYSPSAARSYAIQYCDFPHCAYDDSCSPYMYFSGDDCANFVSQCLIAGGESFGSSYNANDNCGCIVSADDLDSWLCSYATNKYTFHHKGDAVPGEIARGDVVVYYGTYTHATFVDSVGSLKGTDIYLDAHSSSWCGNVSIDGMYSTTFTYCDIFTFAAASSGGCVSGCPKNGGSPPTWLSATPASKGVLVQWLNSSCSQYVLYKRGSWTKNVSQSQPFATVISNGAQYQSFTDSVTSHYSLPNATYFYSIAGVNINGEGLNSHEVSATMPSVSSYTLSGRDFCDPVGTISTSGAMTVKNVNVYHGSAITIHGAPLNILSGTYVYPGSAVNFVSP
jgi:Putative amidase domain